MDFARNLRGFCVGFARNLILFLFEHEHEGYKRFADCTVYGRGGHLGHVTSIKSADFHFVVPESLQKKLFQIGTVVSEKIRFEFLYVHDLGPRSRNDFDLQYSLTFINSIRCLLLPTFRSLAAIVSEKSTVYTFSYTKA